LRLSARIFLKFAVAAARSFARGGAARRISARWIFARKISARRMSAAYGTRLTALLLILFAAQTASASVNIYHLRGNATAGSNNIYRIDPNTGAETVVYTNYPGGNAATLAERPSDGILFYSISPAAGTNGQVYRFNPAVPGAAPVALSATLGAAVANSFRMAFSPSGVLYYMVGANGVAAQQNRLYSVDQTTGAATLVATITGTGDGGDIAFDAAGTLYIINQNFQLYTSPIANGAASFVGTITFPANPNPAPDNSLGIAFDAAGRLLVQTHSPSRLYAVTLPSMASTYIGVLGGGTTATGDLASANAPDPDLSITKTDGVTNTYQGALVTYTITVKNNGAQDVTATVSDTAPAGLTGVTWTCAATAPSTCAVASGSGSINTTALVVALSGGVPGTVTYTLKGTVSPASGTLANTATVSLPFPWLTDATPANNTATDTDSIVVAADLSITKVAAASLAVDNAAAYTLTVRNNGPQAAAGTVTVTDTLPAGLSFVSASGTGWTCANSSGTVTCTMAGPLAVSTNAPVITLNVTVGVAAAPNVSNTASVSNPTFDPSTANNSSTATAPVLYIKLDKSYVLGGPAPKPGTDITYTIAFSNLGGAPVKNLVIADMVPFNTDYKVGSATFSYTLTPTIDFSTAARTAVDPPPTPNPFTPLYTPAGAAGTYDTQLNWVRWSFGAANSIPVGATGTVSFTVRIK
jgi:uncharacterized repeat protein (TIGR01451 family)